MLRHFCDALSDADESWKTAIEEKPCDACLRGESSLLGPIGKLPTDEGLLFLDLHHVTIPEIFTGYMTTLGSLHAMTGFLKSVRVGSKGDAHIALEIVLCYYNSIGRPITWIHVDGAWELMGTKIVIICRAKNICITTTTVASSRKNRQEPQWRVLMSVVRRTLHAARGPCPTPYALWGWAWDHAEEGANLRPSREPPFDCALGRLLSTKDKTVKPPGSYRRPFLCLGYVTQAPRYPGGTLHNKLASQSVYGLCLGYIGSRSGQRELRNLEQQAHLVGLRHAYPWRHTINTPSAVRIEVTSDVRLIPSCKPGVHRTSRGGGGISESGIKDFFNGTAPSSSDDSTSDHSVVKEIQGNDDLEQSDDLEMRPGFAPEPEPDDHQTDAASRGGNEEAGEDAARRGGATPPPAKKPHPVTKRYLVPREQCPDYGCNEHDGKGWEVIVKQRQGVWSLCDFVNARSADGTKFAPEWRRHVSLVELNPSVADQGGESIGADLPAQPPLLETSTLPNAPTAPDSDSGHGGPDLMHSLREDTHRRIAKDDAERAAESARVTNPADESNRAERARRPPDRLAYASLAMASAYEATSTSDYDLKSCRLPEAAFQVNLTGGADRVVMRAFDVSDQWHDEPLLLAGEFDLRKEYDGLPHELQRAALIALDTTRATEEFGESSPQTKMMRELYAVATFDATSRGYRVPPLNPLVHVETGDRFGESVALDDMFSEHLSGALLSADSTVTHHLVSPIFMLSKSSSPDIYTERQLRGPGWDEATQSELAKIERLGAKTDVLADDPSINGMPVCGMLWTGRDKRNLDGSLSKRNARACMRGDLDKGKLDLTGNEATRQTSGGTGRTARDQHPR